MGICKIPTDHQTKQTHLLGTGFQLSTEPKRGLSECSGRDKQRKKKKNLGIPRLRSSWASLGPNKSPSGDASTTWPNSLKVSGVASMGFSFTSLMTPTLAALALLLHGGLRRRRWRDGGWGKERARDMAPVALVPSRLYAPPSIDQLQLALASTDLMFLGELGPCPT